MADAPTDQPVRTMEARELVAEFEAAVNAADPDRAAALAVEDVAVAGPQAAAGGGRALLRDWVGASGIQLHAEQVFQFGDKIIAEQTARVPVEDGGALGEPEETATLFTLRDGRITGVYRYGDLSAALMGATKV
ncbi:nuclear transport factor 2 family protein [Allonocardiopsis opalescens]|uniref:SnoaL-like protein n=1 Tax=Allonocardiopsis opalescens TaxID=1144618 RepID=A0A2T0Q0X4_9ACTN|nr:nuclear transport factor 2 family protein [Allonocardiopsis opalescens]PRX97365.1 SnoaL-like protein [Allonocardiopsis opalescens]